MEEKDYKISVIFPMKKDSIAGKKTWESLKTQTMDFLNEIQTVFCDGDADSLQKAFKECKGKYVTMAEPGEMFSSSVCRHVYDFFEANCRNVDVVGVGFPQWSNLYRKYLKGFCGDRDTIVDLCEAPKESPFFLRGLFFKRELAESILEEQSVFQEVRFLTACLARQKKIGKIAGDALIIYDERPVQKKLSPKEFFSYITELKVVCGECLQKENRIPDFVQHMICMSLYVWLGALQPIMNEYEHPDYHFEEQWEVLSALLQNIDDEMMIYQDYPAFKKLFLLYQKNQKPWDISKNDAGELYLMSAGRLPYQLAEFPLTIDLLSIQNGKLIIEGVYQFPAGFEEADKRIYAVINHARYELESVERFGDSYFFERVWRYNKGFKVEFPLGEGDTSIEWYAETAGNSYQKTVIHFGKLAPLCMELRNSYYYQDGYMVTADGPKILCCSCTERMRKRQEGKLQKEIKKRYPQKAGEVISLRDFYWRQRDKKEKSVWLIMDRPDRADDNAEAFFRYMAEKKDPDVEYSFVLRHDNEKYDELSKFGDILEPFSEEHKKQYLLADYIISSQMAENAFNPFDEDVVFFQDLYRRNRFVFLQHGVINGHHGSVMGKYKRNFYGFVASAYGEAAYLRTPKYFQYTEKEIWLTGLPRFDRLYRDEKNMITIMPTWRQYLTTRQFDPELGTKVWAVNDDFTESAYFKFYDRLINEVRLLRVAEEQGYRICFMPHVTFLREANCFHRDDRVEICEYEKSYREVYAESNLIVTDYSSAVFDFAYLYKPILYCQFDREDFYAGHTYHKGYFDHKRDGFGEVTETEDELVDRMIEYIENGCQLKPMYRERIDKFFAYHDQNNCERVYQKIKA